MITVPCAVHCTNAKSITYIYASLRRISIFLSITICLRLHRIVYFTLYHTPRRHRNFYWFEAGYKNYNIIFVALKQYSISHYAYAQANHMHIV